MRSLMNACPVLLCTGTPPAALDNLARIPGQTRIVNDLAAGVVRQHRLGKQTDDVVTLR